MTHRSRALATFLGIALVACLVAALSKRPSEPTSIGTPTSRTRVEEPVTLPPRLEGVAALSPKASPPPQRALWAAIRGVVTSPDGTPRPSAMVSLSRWVPRTTSHGEDVLVERLVGSRRTNGAGRFAFEDLEPGRYWAVAPAPPGLLAARRDLELSDEDVEIVLPFLRAMAPRIEVVTETGEAVLGAEVVLSQSGANLRSASTGADGMATLSDVDPRWECRLKVSPPWERRLEFFEAVRNVWQPGDDRIVLEQALLIRGRVIDEAGVPVANASVSHQNSKDGEKWLGQRTKEDGSFRIGRLRPGPVTLRVGPPGTSLAHPLASVIVEAGREDLELTIPRGASLKIVFTNWRIAAEPANGIGTVVLTPMGRPTERHAFPIQGDATAEAVGLEAGMDYILWGRFHPLFDRYLLVRGVRASAEPLEVRIEKGGTISGRAIRPKGLLRYHIVMHGPGVSREGLVNPEDGTFRIHGVPPGRWTVHAGTFKGWWAEAPAQAGDEIELTLEPYEER